MPLSIPELYISINEVLCYYNTVTDTLERFNYSYILRDIYTTGQSIYVHNLSQIIDCIQYNKILAPYLPYSSLLATPIYSQYLLQLILKSLILSSRNNLVGVLCCYYPPDLYRSVEDIKEDMAAMEFIGGNVNFRVL